MLSARAFWSFASLLGPRGWCGCSSCVVGLVVTRSNGWAVTSHWIWSPDANDANGWVIKKLKNIHFYQLQILWGTHSSTVSKRFGHLKPCFCFGIAAVVTRLTRVTTFSINSYPYLSRAIYRNQTVAHCSTEKVSGEKRGLPLNLHVAHSLITKYVFCCVSLQPFLQ